MKQRTAKIIRSLLVVLFLSYYAESTLFVHSHTFNWGTVSHSHPYLPGHSHSQGECQTIAQLNNILFTLTTATVIVPVIVYLLCRYRERSFQIVGHTMLNVRLRAPPQFICR